MKKKKVYKCQNEVVMEGTGMVAFTKGRLYTRIQPEVWPPIETNVIACFIDDLNEQHFFDSNDLHKHFERSNPLIP